MNEYVELFIPCREVCVDDVLRTGLGHKRVTDARGDTRQVLLELVDEFGQSHQRREPHWLPVHVLRLQSDARAQG